MDEQEFRRILDLFPIVRSPHYHADSESSGQSTSQSGRNVELKEWQDAWGEGDKRDIQIEGIDEHDAFWKKLKLVAEKKVGAAKAEEFCKAFQRVHKKLVYEELSLDAARSFIKSSKGYHHPS
ncbi:hypothetical protein LguiA_021519 [Lonicera macranthoides]